MNITSEDIDTSTTRPVVRFGSTGTTQISFLMWKTTTKHNQVLEFLWSYLIINVFSHLYKYISYNVCKNPNFDFLIHKGNMIGSHLIHLKGCHRQIDIYDNSVISLEVHEDQDLSFILVSPR